MAFVARFCCSVVAVCSRHHMIIRSIHTIGMSVDRLSDYVKLTPESVNRYRSRRCACDALSTNVSRHGVMSSSIVDHHLALSIHPRPSKRCNYNILSPWPLNFPTLSRDLRVSGFVLEYNGLSCQSMSGGKFDLPPPRRRRRLQPPMTTTNGHCRGVSTRGTTSASLQNQRGEKGVKTCR